MSGVGFLGGPGSVGPHDRGFDRWIVAISELWFDFGVKPSRVTQILLSERFIWLNYLEGRQARHNGGQASYRRWVLSRSRFAKSTVMTGLYQTPTLPKLLPLPKKTSARTKSL